MKNTEKAKDILELIVSAATAVVALAAMWKKIWPDVKKALGPVLDGCKKIAAQNLEHTPALTGNK